MIRAIVDGEASVSQLMFLARGSLQRKTEAFFYALSGKITKDNRFVLQKSLSRTDFFEQERESLEQKIFFRMKPYKRQWQYSRQYLELTN